MDPTDESKRKPRRTRGTPSYYYRNRFALAFIVTGTAIAAAWLSIPAIRRIDSRIGQKLAERTEEEFDRRALFNFGVARTSASIREAIKEKEDLIKER